MEYAREDLVELAGGERGGVVQGYTPVHSHVQLYLVQIVLVIVLCFVLGQVVKKWNQPRVIAEVGGFGRWVAPYVNLCATFFFSAGGDAVVGNTGRSKDPQRLSPCRRLHVCTPVCMYV